MEPLPAANEYFSLSVRLLLAFGVIFELPILMIFLARIGLVTSDLLRRNRKYAILISFIVAAILTPTPDVVNQVLMAGPLIVLFEVSILFVSIFGKKTFTGFKHGDKKKDRERE